MIQGQQMVEKAVFTLLAKFYITSPPVVPTHIIHDGISVETHLTGAVDVVSVWSATDLELEDVD
jgi:hypothetical protein